MISSAAAAGVGVGADLDVGSDGATDADADVDATAGSVVCDASGADSTVSETCAAGRDAAFISFSRCFFD